MDITKYFKSGSVALLSKVLMTLSSLAIIWLATAYLGKEDFGNFIYVYSWVSILAAIASTPFASIVLYRISRMEDGESAGESYASYGTLGTVIFALMISVAMASTSGFWSGWIEKPGAEYWFFAMALLLPLDALRLTLASWQQAQQKTVFMMLCRDILPFTLRAVFLFFVWVFTAGNFAAVILAYGLSLVIPLLVLYGSQPLQLKTLIQKSPLNRWDIFYSLKSLAIQIIHRPSQNIDILLLGALAPAEIVAEYALASRLAGLLMMGKDALMPLLNPRMGKFMKSGDKAALESEYSHARNISLGLALLGCLFFAFAGPYVLRLFEGYQSSFPLLMALCAVMLIRVGTGANGEYIIMRGNAGWSLSATIPSVIIGALTGWWLVPLLGGLGAAIALFAMVLSINVLLCIVIWRQDGFIVCPQYLLALLALTSAILFAASFGSINSVWLMVSLVLVTAFFVLATRKDWMTLTQLIKAAIPNAKSS
ncbi:MAG: oligosaccharide flippase family protein [Micavibrio sp.]|nr:oligosaccharide flippase family protein [Micavibrio sp.]